MTKAELMQAVFEEMKARLVTRLENDQRLVDEVNKTAPPNELYYQAYGRHIKEMLTLVESMQEPELCSECETPLFNPDRVYRFMCDDCGDTDARIRSNKNERRIQTKPS